MRLSTNALPRFYSTAGRESSRSKEIQRVFIKPLKLGCAASVGAVCLNKLHSLELPLTWWWSQEQEGRAGDQERKKSISTASPVTMKAFEHARNLGPPETNVPATVSTVGGWRRGDEGWEGGFSPGEESLCGVRGHRWISPSRSPLCFGEFRALRSPTGLSGEFRFTERDGQFQVLLLLLGQPGQSLLLLSLALALCPLYHVFLCWILPQHTNTHITRFRSVERNKSGTKTRLNPVNCFSLMFPTGCLK